jgi:hypothetical protein
MVEVSRQTSSGDVPGTDESTGVSALDRSLSGASAERRDIFEQLKQRPWFRNTSLDLQIELAGLPAEAKCNFDGFLRDLANRPDRISNVNVISLERLARGNFAIVPIFNVQNDKGDRFTYEYVSWRYGPQSGVKGLVLIETGGVPTHFVVLRGEKFATGKIEADSVGGFIDLNVDGVLKAVDRVKKEIQEELGLPDVKLIRDPVELGKLAVDPGMTNNRPGLFLASIDASDAEKLQRNPINPDPYELAGAAIVYPISQLKEVVLRNEDSFFLSCVARAWASGAIPF